MIALLLACLAQDGEIDRLLSAHDQKMRAAGSPGEGRRVLAETRAKLDAFVKEHPKHPDVPRAAWHAAESLLATGELDPALERLRALVRDHPDAAPSSNARFAIGEALLDKEDWAGARAAAADFLQRHPKDERAFFAKALTGSAFAAEGDYDRAAETLRAARDAHKERPESWGALLQIAVYRHAQERNDDARRALDEVIQNCPDRDTQELARLHLSAYLKLGGERPAVAGKDLKGADAGADALAGKVSVIYFFDSTFTQAVGEIRSLKKIREALPDLAILGVSVDLDRKDLAAFAARERPDWPLLHDGKGYDGGAARAYDVRRVPSLWICDRKGRLRYHNLAGPDLRRAIAGLLQEK
ncbi:MAG TPA: tetratricopeptide repeat protein [Planctomycetota bacterium]